MAKRRISPTNAKTTAGSDNPAEVTAATTVSKATSSKPSTPLVPASSATAPTAAAESKQSRLVALLRRAEGATIAELMAATGWMSHSVRGALSAVVKRKLGLVVDSCLEVDRGRVYRIAPPPVIKPTAGRRKAKPATSQASASSAPA